MKKQKLNNNLSDIELQQTNNVQEEKPEQKYDKELLVKSKRLEEFHLHPDMIRAILVKPEYTISDAKLAIQKYIDSFNQ
jgi:hypothetical protein